MKRNPPCSSKRKHDCKIQNWRNKKYMKIFYIPNIKKNLLSIKKIRRSPISQLKLIKLKYYVKLANEINVDITFFDVVTNERRRKTMKEEMEAISKNHIWMLVKFPQRHKPILVKWIFKIKEDQHK